MGLPGLRGVDHVAVTVPDLDVALAFLTDVLGLELIVRRGALDDGSWFVRHMALDQRTAITRWALLGDGAGPTYEVFEYRAADQRTAWPAMSDHGGHHLALRVDDMDAAIAHLDAHGVEVLGGKILSKAPGGGAFAHFYTPWGQLFELVWFPAAA